MLLPLLLPLVFCIVRWLSDCLAVVLSIFECGVLRRDTIEFQCWQFNFFCCQGHKHNESAGTPLFFWPRRPLRLAKCFTAAIAAGISLTAGQWQNTLGYPAHTKLNKQWQDKNRTEPKCVRNQQQQRNRSKIFHGADPKKWFIKRPCWGACCRAGVDGACQQLR